MRCLEYFILAQEASDTGWELPWAGIGAALAGMGSFLSGYAALKLARRQGGKDETTPSTDSGTDVGSGGGISDSSSDSEWAGESDTNSDD